MLRTPLRPHTSRHVNIFDDDWELLERLYGTHSESRIGVSGTVRAIIHTFCNKLRARIGEAEDQRQQQEEDTK